MYLHSLEGARRQQGSAPATAMDDPEERALLYVQQYLKESGFTQALAVLEKECGLLYDEDKYMQGSELLQLIYNQMEHEVEERDPEDDAARARAEDDRALLQAGRGDIPTHPLHRISGVHSANVLVVRLWPGKELLATGSADGMVHLLRFDGGVEWSTHVASGGALSLEWSPGVTQAAGSAAEQSPAGTSLDGRRLAVVGSMDGSVSILDADTGKLLCSIKPHAKYVVRATFDPRPGSNLIATASFDQTCCLLRLVEGSGGDAGAATGGIELEMIRQVHHTGAVQDVAFLPLSASGEGPAAADGSTVLVAVRDSGCLERLEAGTGEDLTRISLHSGDEDHLSLSPMRLAFSPCGRYLLVALEGPRLVVLRTSDWSRARALYGLHVARFHNHAVAWHRDAAYAYASADGAAVHVYHVGTGKVAARLEGQHRVNVRDLDVDWGRNLLATCSFDKTVRVFCHQAEA